MFLICCLKVQVEAMVETVRGHTVVVRGHTAVIEKTVVGGDIKSPKEGNVSADPSDL